MPSRGPGAQQLQQLEGPYQEAQWILREQQQGGLRPEFAQLLQSSMQQGQMLLQQKQQVGVIELFPPAI